MDVRKRRNKSGTVWVVRWREGSKRRARTFPTRKLAEQFAVRQSRSKQRAGVADRGNLTLDEFFDEWQQGHGVHLAQATQDNYAWTWQRHISDVLGAHTLRELSERPEIIQRFHAQLAQQTGAPTVRRTLVILQGVMQRAIEWNRIRYNPVAAIRKPKGGRKRAVRPLSPEQIEKVIGLLSDQDRPRDVTLIAVLAYAGLRPGETLALQWHHVRSRTLLIEAAVADGQLKETKTGRIRSVQLLPTLADDLAAWRERQSADHPADLVFARSDGGYWTAGDWKNWRNRVFAPAMEAAGISGTRPYDLRHSFCSLLIQEGRSVVEVAQQMGHAPEMTLSTYAHVFAEAADPLDRMSAAEQIATARSVRPGSRRGLKLDPSVLRGIEEIDWSGHKSLLREESR